MNRYVVSAGVLASLMLSACSDEIYDVPGQDASGGRNVISLAGQINQEAVCRV